MCYYFIMDSEELKNYGSKIKILALDIATTTGWACGKGDRLKYSNFTVNKCDTIGDKFLRFGSLIERLIYLKKPEIIAIERPIIRFYAATYWLCGACAIAEMAAASKNIPVVKFPPTTIKKFVTGSGRATKEDMMKAIKKLKFKPEVHDEADAIGLHLYTQSQLFFKLEEDL